MKKLGLLIIAAVFLAGLVAASANAQMGGGKGKGGAMGMGPKGGGMGMVQAVAWECGMAPTAGISPACWVWTTIRQCK